MHRGSKIAQLFLRALRPGLTILAILFCVAIFLPTDKRGPIVSFRFHACLCRHAPQRLS